MYKILAINPGSTSTKIAVYDDEQELFKDNLEHSAQELAQYEKIFEQHHLRKDAVLSVLQKNNFDMQNLAAVVGRGGLLPPVKSGAYRVNEAMIDRLQHRPVVEHASNLGAAIAYDIAQPLDVPAFIYDPVSVDELQDVARISGMPDIQRQSLSHALNMRAAAIRVAGMLHKPYPEATLIVAHLGGGISLSVHQGGKMIDIVSDDEGPFSPEGSGRVPCRKLIELCYAGKYERKEMSKKLRGKGGLIAYLETNKTLEVEEKINAGDKNAELIYYAMAYQIAKSIGELATVVKGKVDRIVLTGGIAYSARITGWITERVEFIAPVDIIAGENELESLAMGALRVLKGEETAYEYDLG